MRYEIQGSRIVHRDQDLSFKHTVTGLIEPAEEHRTRAFQDHLDNFQACLRVKGNSRSHTNQTVRCAGKPVPFPVSNFRN